MENVFETMFAHTCVSLRCLAAGRGTRYVKSYENREIMETNLIGTNIYEHSIKLNMKKSFIQVLSGADTL